MAGYNNPMAFRMASADIFELMNTPYSGGSSSHTAAIGLCSLSFPCQHVISSLPSGVQTILPAHSCHASIYKHHKFASACGWQTPVTAIVNNKGGV